MENKELLSRGTFHLEKGKTLYRSSTILAYWSFRNRDKYLAVRVAFILQSKEEIIVEIINDDVVSISAPAFSPPASMAYSALSTKTNELESEFPVLKESCINKNVSDDYQRLKIEEYDKQRKSLTVKCTPTYSHILHRERHIVTDDISIEDNDSFGRNLLTEQEKLINYARYCLKLTNTLNYARVNYTEEVVSVCLCE